MSSVQMEALFYVEQKNSFSQRDLKYNPSLATRQKNIDTFGNS